MFREAILIAVFMLGSLMAENAFDVDYTSTCTQTDDGICVKWSHSGEIKEKTASCFPAGSRVITEDGIKFIEDIEIGTMLLGYNTKTGKNEFMPMELWLHRFGNIESNYYNITTETSGVIASPFHNLAIANDSQPSFKYAEDFEVGDCLWGDSDDGSMVVEINVVKMMGIYAPYTQHGTFYIMSPSGPNIVTDNFYLAHSFAHIRNPTLYQPVISGIMSAAKMVYPTIHDISPDSKDNYVHPVAKILSNMFPFMLDSVPKTFIIENNSLRTSASKGGSGSSGNNGGSSNNNKNNDDDNKDDDMLEELAMVLATVLSFSSCQ